MNYTSYADVVVRGTMKSSGLVFDVRQATSGIRTDYLIKDVFNIVMDYIVDDVDEKTFIQFWNDYNLYDRVAVRPRFIDTGIMDITKEVIIDTLLATIIRRHYDNAFPGIEEPYNRYKLLLRQWEDFYYTKVIYPSYSFVWKKPKGPYQKYLMYQIRCLRYVVHMYDVDYRIFKEHYIRKHGKKFDEFVQTHYRKPDSMCDMDYLMSQYWTILGHTYSPLCAIWIN